MDKIKLGISACLLGRKVRYDGGHKRNRFIAGRLGKRFTLVPVCPEVEAGLSIPREPMQLTGDAAAPRLVVISSGIDLTGMMNGWAGRKVKRLEREGICGLILKSRSPSCAAEDAELSGASGRSGGRASGMFTAQMRRHDPCLPVTDEEDFADPVLRENFIERVFVYRRWHDFSKKKPSSGNLVSFHSGCKLQIMAHSPRHYAALGKLVAGAQGRPIRTVYRRYFAMLMDGLSSIATPGKNANVLMHVMGYFKKRLSTKQKQVVLKEIERYRKGRTSLDVPRDRLKRYAMRFGEQYLMKQSYLKFRRGAP